MSKDPVAQAPFRPRNLVMLSDGTGNSAAKLFRTNVWRIYEALDLNCDDQIALYDDGVGTASFKPLALLGGAFGYGLKRNVLDLYTFLCRNYRAADGYVYNPAQPSSDDASMHDRIFSFGFSRGAFTARVLASLVANEGLIQRAETDAELERLARWAYRSYRAKRYRRHLVVRVLRSVRDAALRLVQIRKQAYDRTKNRDVPVDFIGVFDTVAAYGLPIDELTRGWDRWIWPMTPRDRSLNDRVKVARHAVAIDDERQTFFPVLWDENSDKQKQRNAQFNHPPDRIAQVWFAGMHSNVGGGYADDALSYGPLVWMAREAETRGLRFQAGLRPNGHVIPEAWVERAAACAPMGDSRRGVGAYYRYHPRPIAQLCGFKGQSMVRNPKSLVQIDLPKIHESVFERIHDSRENYAPLGLPEKYVVVRRNGDLLCGDGPAPNPNPFEHSTQAGSRVIEQQAAWDMVWVRRVVYFATVAATLILLALPLLDLNPTVADSSHWGALALGAIGGFLPAFAEQWIGAYAHIPGWFMLAAGTVLVLFVAGKRLKRRVNDRMAVIWSAERRANLTAAPLAAPALRPGGWIYRLRESDGYKATFHFLSRTLWPNVFGLAMLVLIAGFLPLRLGYQWASRTQGFGTGEHVDTVPVHQGSASEVWLYPDEIQRRTLIKLERGQRYAIQIAIPSETAESAACDTVGLSDEQKKRVGGWKDATIAVPSIAGVPGTEETRAMSLFRPFRRIWMLNWFVPVAAIGRVVPERHYLSTKVTEFTATRSGPLYLYVNDAAIPNPFGGCFSWDCFYRNNSGGPARVRVTNLEARMTVSDLQDFTRTRVPSSARTSSQPGAERTEPNQFIDAVTFC